MYSYQYRDIGSEGYNMAADYVANYFKQYRLESMNTLTPYFQEVSILQSSISKASFLMKMYNRSVPFLM